MMKIKPLAIMAAMALAYSMAPGAAWAKYPERPITIVVGFTPGGGADTVARIVSEHMAKTLGQPIIIENKPGAGTTIAASQVARAKPDGYTLFLGSPILFGVDKILYKSITYGPKDFAPISQWTVAPMILAVNPSLPVKTVPELIALAKKKPGNLFVASSGTGGSPYLTALAFQKHAGVKFTHVPFKGGAPAIQAVVAGDVQLTFGTPPSVLPLMTAGRLRGLGVTSAERSPLLPDMPTIAEQGVKGFNQTFWFGLFAPAGTDSKAVQTLYDASVEALKDPGVRKKLASEGNDAKWSASPAEFAAWVKNEGSEHAKLAEEAGLATQ